MAEAVLAILPDSKLQIRIVMFMSRQPRSLVTAVYMGEAEHRRACKKLAMFQAKQLQKSE